jgi:hypothetical protein
MSEVKETSIYQQLDSIKKHIIIHNNSLMNILANIKNLTSKHSEISLHNKTEIEHLNAIIKENNKKTSELENKLLETQNEIDQLKLNLETAKNEYENNLNDVNKNNKEDVNKLIDSLRIKNNELDLCNSNISVLNENTKKNIKELLDKTNDETNNSLEMLKEIQDNLSIMDNNINSINNEFNDDQSLLPSQSQESESEPSKVKERSHKTQPSGTWDAALLNLNKQKGGSIKRNKIKKRTTKKRKGKLCKKNKTIKMKY